MINNVHYLSFLRAAIIFVIAALFSGSSYAQFIFEDATESSKINQSVAAVADIGGGVVVLDLNKDGWEDLYLPGAVIADKLFINQKDGTFKDVTDPTFAKHNNFNSYTHGGVAFDFDKDGHIDIFEVCRRKDLLWKNNGNGTFINFSQPANIVEPFDENVSNSATYGDFDGDGDNDIYVARWVKSFDAELDSFGVSRYVLKGFENHLYVNNNNSTFTEKAVAFGVNDSGTTNTCVMFDYDKDGDLDILTGNDFGMNVRENSVYQNQLAQTGVASFIDVAPAIGLDVKIYNMTLSHGDYDRDGDFDLFQTSIGGEYLYRNNDGMFANVAQDVGFPALINPQIGIAPTITWTALINDYDNDGREDIFVTHGYLRALIEDLATQELDTTRFYHQQPDNTFKDITVTNGVVTDVRGRGAAALDYDQDGRLDIILGSLGRTPGVKTADYRVFRNITPITSDRNWVQIKCDALTTASDAIGTIIEVWVGGTRHTKQVSTNGGFGSSTSLVQHFGLGSATVIDTIILYWPMSNTLHRQIDRYHNVPVNQRISYQEQPKSSVNSSPESSQGYSLTPSITSSSITISGASEQEVTTYRIVNTLGQTVQTHQGRKGTVELTMSSLAKGSYFVVISSSKGKEIVRFIKV